MKSTLTLLVMLIVFIGCTNVQSKVEIKNPIRDINFFEMVNLFILKVRVVQVI
jgi:hypothetical protein